MKCPFCIKVCTKCKERIGEARLLVAYKGNFHKDKTGKYGFTSYCKECKNKHTKDTKSYKKEYDKQYYKENKQRKKEYYKNNREHRKEYMKGYLKQYREDNKEYIKEYNKRHYKDTLDYRKEYSKQYYDKYLEENGLERSQGSYGEQKVRQVLNQSNITFVEQHRFDECKLYRPLPFDFYIPHLNTIIEYDGIQHFNIVEQFGGLDGFIDTIIRDSIKNDYCRRNNIRLIRIPYYEFDNIEQILSDLL